MLLAWSKYGLTRYQGYRLARFQKQYESAAYSESLINMAVHDRFNNNDKIDRSKMRPS